MKILFINVMSIEKFCCFSDVYGGWNDTVGSRLSSMADSAISGARREISSCLSGIQDNDSAFVSDLQWITATLNSLE